MSALLKLGVLVGAGSLPFLCLDCIERAAPVIEYELQNNVRAGFKKDDQLQGVMVSGDGRHIFLTGKVSLESTKKSAGALANSQQGVAVVSNQIAVSGGASEVQLRLRMMLARRSIQFNPGESELADPSQAILNDLRDALMDAPTANIQIEGYTDNSGDEEKNRVISQKRAQAVLNWLADRGIDRGRMQAVGYGPERPLFPNDTADNRARNRRIEVKLSER